MKAITSKEKLSKFLVVNDEAQNMPHNKHILKPYKNGEMVEVAPFEEQVRCDKYDHIFKYVKPNNDPEYFRQRYVVVYRKDDNGKFTLKYTESWKNFDSLTKIKTSNEK